MKKIVQVKLSDLKDSFYIRTKLNDDRLQYLWSLREGGVKLPPILITKDNKIVWGRHRVYVEKELMNNDTIEAEITEEEDFLTLVKMSYEENSEGPLPPTKDDLFHTMTPLVQKGIPLKKVANAFSFLPYGMVKMAYHHAQWREENKKLLKAQQLVIEQNFTVKKAAEILGVKEEKLKEFMNRKKPNGASVTACKKEIGQRFNHFNRVNGQKIGDLFKWWDDGIMIREDANSVFRYLGKLIINQNKMYADWQKRWDSKK
jgi:hypothetical protein